MYIAHVFEREAFKVNVDGRYRVPAVFLDQVGYFVRFIVGHVGGARACGGVAVGLTAGDIFGVAADENEGGVVDALARVVHYGVGNLLAGVLEGRAEVLEELGLHAVGADDEQANDACLSDSIHKAHDVGL